MTREESLAVQDLIQKAAIWAICMANPQAVPGLTPDEAQKAVVASNQRLDALTSPAALEAQEGTSDV